MKLWDWFDANKRTIPWRDLTIKNDTDRAYRIWISEVMLQQTQVPRVTETYKKFIQIFPDLESLGKASNAEILRAWKGMGYNSRALRLRDGARTIVEKYGRGFPRTVGELLSIKGIGPYTARAILIFAFDEPHPAIDVNIRRILHRFFVGPETTEEAFAASDETLAPILSDILSTALSMKRGTAKDFFAALMDFGSLVCTKSNPKWHLLTPRMASVCASYGVTIAKTKRTKKEPGRIIGQRFVPERITRGKVVECLRHRDKGASLPLIGKHVAPDWDEKLHRLWMQKILTKLVRDELVQSKAKGLYTL
jgi:A/G-specific adenine glycosylase